MSVTWKDSVLKKPVLNPKTGITEDVLVEESSLGYRNTHLYNTRIHYEVVKTIETGRIIYRLKAWIPATGVILIKLSTASPRSLEDAKECLIELSEDSVIKAIEVLQAITPGRIP